jgi:hypothetical protein
MCRQKTPDNGTGAAATAEGGTAAMAAADNSNGCPAVCAGQDGGEEDVAAGASLLLHLKQQSTSTPAAAPAAPAAVMAVSAAAAGEEGRDRASNGIALSAVCDDSGLVGSPGVRSVSRSRARRSSGARDTPPNSTDAGNLAAPQRTPPAAAAGGGGGGAGM